MGPKEKIEDFMRRYGCEGNRVLWVLALPALVGAILVVMVWLSLGPAGTQTSVDRNDVVWACGRKVLPEYQELAEYRDITGGIARGMRKDCCIYGPQATGTWGTEPRGTCRVQYPHPPGRWQHMAWHERAL